MRGIHSWLGLFFSPQACGLTIYGCLQGEPIWTIHPLIYLFIHLVHTHYWASTIYQVLWEILGLKRWKIFSFCAQGAQSHRLLKSWCIKCYYEGRRGVFWIHKVGAWPDVGYGGWRCSRQDSGRVGEFVQVKWGEDVSGQESSMCKGLERKESTSELPWHRLAGRGCAEKAWEWFSSISPVIWIHHIYPFLSHFFIFHVKWCSKKWS